MDQHKFTIDDIRIDEFKDPIITDSILNGLRVYSTHWLGVYTPQHFCFYIMDDSSKIIAGVYGAISHYLQAKTAWIYKIWAEKTYRGQGFGANLLAHLNNFAYNNNCTTIQVEVFDFQGIAFFEKQGFQTVEIITNVLAGRDKFFMYKAPRSSFISLDLAPIILDKTENQEIKQAISSGVDYFNTPYFGDGAQKPFSLFIQGSSKSVIGGIIGQINNQYAWVNVMWVNDNYRGQGAGIMLWKKLEIYLRSKNCSIVFVSTLEFQAKLFYEKLGCKCQGTVNKWMGGYNQYWFEKILT